MHLDPIVMTLGIDNAVSGVIRSIFYCKLTLLSIIYSDFLQCQAKCFVFNRHLVNASVHNYKQIIKLINYLC